MSIDDVTSPDVHTGSLDAVFSLFYALSVHRQKIKGFKGYKYYCVFICLCLCVIAATAVQQTSTPVKAKESQSADPEAPPSVPPKSKKLQNGDNESVTQRSDYIR